MLTIIQPSKHIVKDTTVARLFRRRLNTEDIITFWNAETGQWVLAYYVDQKRRIVDEIDDLGMSFENVTAEFIHMVTQCWKPVDWKAKKQRLVSKEADRIRKENDDLQEQQRRWDWAKKQRESQGKCPLPYAFKSPISGGEVL